MCKANATNNASDASGKSIWVSPIIIRAKEVVNGKIEDTWEVRGVKEVVWIRPSGDKGR